jgi:hypothetical protein
VKYIERVCAEFPVVKKINEEAIAAFSMVKQKMAGGAA